MSSTRQAPGDGTTVPPSLTLSQLRGGLPLAQALSKLEQEVRRMPDQHRARWALTELSCVLGHWERALKQAQICARLAPQTGPQVSLIGELIRAEHQRERVFAGEQAPAPMIDQPDWMRELIEALRLHAQGDLAAADRCRERALADAPSPAGEGFWADPSAPAQLSHAPFSWLSDSDSRLGPVCELIIAGAYRWVPWQDVAEIELDAPAHLLDIVWMPVRLRLRTPTAAGARTMHAYLPARYPLMTRNPAVTLPVRAHHGDALLLGHLTEWHNVGETGVFASGQKTWMSDTRDWSLFDLRSLRLNEAGATPQTPAPQAHP